jgi:hypothetical protein
MHYQIPICQAAQREFLLNNQLFLQLFNNYQIMKKDGSHEPSFSRSIIFLKPLDKLILVCYTFIKELELLL